MSFDVKDINKLKVLREKLNSEITQNNEVKHIDDKVENIESKINNSEKAIYDKETRRPQRREIWYVDLGNPKGSLQKGLRPCLVDSNNINNKYSNIINVYPLTSQMTKAKIPVHIEVEGYGLKEKSIILIEQGLPIDIRFQLKDYIGTVDELVMKRVDIARNIQHGDLKPKTTFERLNKDQQQYIVDKLNIIRECATVLRFLTRVNGHKKDIDIAEDEKFEAENALMSFCYKHGLNCDEFYTQENGINEEIAL